MARGTRRAPEPGGSPGRGLRAGLNPGPRRVLDVIEACRREKRLSPTVREIAAACGGLSTATVAAALDILEQRGFIRREGRAARGITLPRTPRSAAPGAAAEVPILPAAEGDVFWRGNPEGSLLVDRRLVGKKALAAVRLTAREGAPIPPGLPVRSRPVTYLVLERTPPAAGEAGAYPGVGGVWAGSCYTTDACHRFYDLFTGEEMVLAPESAGHPLGKVVAVITFLDVEE